MPISVVPPEWWRIIPGSRLEVEKVDGQNLGVEVRVETRLLRFNLAEPPTSSDEAYHTSDFPPYCVPAEWWEIIPGFRLEVEKVDEQNLGFDVRVGTRLLRFNLAQPLTSTDEAFPTTDDIDTLVEDAYPEKDNTVELPIAPVNVNKLKKEQPGMNKHVDKLDKKHLETNKKLNKKPSSHLDKLNKKPSSHRAGASSSNRYDP
jgi:hypothetical protein